MQVGHQQHMCQKCDSAASALTLARAAACFVDNEHSRRASARAAAGGARAHLQSTLAEHTCVEAGCALGKERVTEVARGWARMALLAPKGEACARQQRGDFGLLGPQQAAKGDGHATGTLAWSVGWVHLEGSPAGSERKAEPSCPKRKVKRLCR